MGMTQGTHDDATPETIGEIALKAFLQYQFRQFVETVVEFEITMAVAEALESEGPLD